MFTPPCSSSWRTSDSISGPATLIRWYTLHVILLPLACIALMAMHFWRIRKDGGISTPIPYDEDGETEQLNDNNNEGKS